MGGQEKFQKPKKKKKKLGGGLGEIKFQKEKTEIRSEKGKQKKST